METCHNIIQALDQISIAEIFSYLGAIDVLHLSLTCKDFHRIVSKSPYIVKSLFENLFGRNVHKKEMSNLTYTKFHEILKNLFIANTLSQPLPFFGFRGNCGCDKNNPSYLFDKIFEAKKERRLVCTDAGENFDIEGVLSEDYARETKHVQNIIAAIDQTDLDENPDLYPLKVMLQRYGSWALDLFPPDPNDLFEENLEPLREFLKERANYLRDRNDKYHIELPCQKMMKSIGLIQSCHLMRETEHLTCPVKTLMAFASVNEEIRSSPLASLFSQCKTSDDLIQLLQNQKNQLPDINQTSIKKLAESSLNIKYIDEEEDDVEFVVFNSNGKKQDVIPIFWVNFNKPITKDLFLDFKDCNLSGRFVMLKLIQCEDLREGSTMPDYPKNIDFKFCCFYGPVIDF